jgi:hypothetical protein
VVFSEIKAPRNEKGRQASFAYPPFFLHPYVYFQQSKARLRPKMGLKLFAFDVLAQLGYFEAKSNTLFSFHALLRVHEIKKMIQGVRSFFQVDEPGFFRLIIGHLNIGSAGTYFRIKRGDLLA